MGLDKAGKSVLAAQLICPSGKIALSAAARNGVAMDRPLSFSC